jgi:hypothetical protein
MDLDIVDASSIDTHFRTVQSEPPTSTEARFEPSASTHPLVDDDHYQDIVWARLPGYIRPPTSDKLRAWFWKYGYYVQQGLSSERYWFCRECHSKKPYRTTKYIIAGVDNIKKHLLNVHWISKNGPLSRKRSRTVFEQLQLNADDPKDQQVMNWMNSRFDPERFKRLLLSWVVSDAIPFHKLESEHFRKLCEYLRPQSRPHIPHHTTMRSMIIDEDERHLPVIVDLLQNATTRIHLSFDIWTSRQMRCLAGK